jgi:hypothetical protein
MTKYKVGDCIISEVGVGVITEVVTVETHEPPQHSYYINGISPGNKNYNKPNKNGQYPRNGIMILEDQVVGKLKLEKV